MLSEKSAVTAKLRERVLAGYNPTRDSESANDHWADWYVLSPEEFEEIKKAAAEEKAAIKQTRIPFEIPQFSSKQEKFLLLALFDNLPVDGISNVTGTLQQWGVDATETEIITIYKWLGETLKA